MNIAKESQAIEATLTSYRERLDSIPDEVFAQTPPNGGWSAAEVYSHILQATLGSSIALERCINNTSQSTSKGLSFLGHLMMFTGRFPPLRVKVPKAIEAKMPASKITKEEAKNLIIKCRKRISDATPRIEDSVIESRHQHPRLGMLNAQQWFKFIRIHLQHHIKQLDRIKKVSAH
jgi:hypothetical protein